MNYIGELIPLLIISAVIIIAFLKNCEVFNGFKVGASKGITTAVNLLPTLFGIIIAVNMLSASGALDEITKLISPITEKLGFPSELLPLAIIKPISGSGAMGITTDIFEKFGTDSQIGQMASVMMASTETTIYAVTVYFSAKNYKSLKYTVPVALLGDIATMILAVTVIRYFG